MVIIIGGGSLLPSNPLKGDSLDIRSIDIIEPEKWLLNPYARALVTERDWPKVGKKEECLPGPPTTITIISSFLDVIGIKASSSKSA